MDNPKVILSPDGAAIVLDKISYVGTVYTTHDRGYKPTGYSFAIQYEYGKSSKSGFTLEYLFNYTFQKYAEDAETLLKKVQNIRNEILKMMNNGVEVKEVLCSIQLKKNG